MPRFPPPDTELSAALVSYESLRLVAPLTWEELVLAEPAIESANVRVMHDLVGRLVERIRVVKPGGASPPFEMPPATIKIQALGLGDASRSGPKVPMVYLFDYGGDGMTWVGPWVLVPVGSELLVKDEWGRLSVEEGRLILHEDGVEIIPGPVERPPGLCERYAGNLLIAELAERECTDSWGGARNGG